MTPDPFDALRLPIVPVDPRPEFAAALLRRIESGTEGGAESGIEGGAESGVEGGAEGSREPVGGPAATIRYFVNDLDTAVAFYCDLLGFDEELRTSGAFAMLYRGDLRLLLSVPGGPGAGRAWRDGTLPEPGGSNRILIQVPDLAANVEELRRKGARFRDDIVTGVAVRQILLHDPAGNLVELFEPLAGYHERPTRRPR